MKPVRSCWSLALLPWCAGLALAQQPAPAPTAEAMERARRDAANPMRVILEAGRIQQRRRPEGPPATTAAPTPAPTSAAAPASVPPRREPARTPAEPVQAAPTAAAEAPVAATAAPVTPSTVPPPADARPAVETAVARPAESPTPAISPAAEVLAAPIALPVPVREPVVEPKLVNLVEPVIPPRVLGSIGALREVTADLSLRADGSVSAVALAPDTPRAAVRYLTQALEQWRFSPLPAARVHRVQVVFTP